MQNVELFSRFVLFDPDDNSNLTSDPIFSPTQTISFEETLNQPNCTYANPVGTQCDDIFEFQPLVGSFDFLTRDGFNYTIFFDFQPTAGTEYQSGSVLSNDEDVVSVFTGEEQTSQLDIQARIEATRVPEPSTLTLMGIALAAMGFAFRRRFQ